MATTTTNIVDTITHPMPLPFSASTAGIICSSSYLFSSNTIITGPTVSLLIPSQFKFGSPVQVNRGSCRSWTGEIHRGARLVRRKDDQPGDQHSEGMVRTRGLHVVSYCTVRFEGAAGARVSVGSGPM